MTANFGPPIPNGRPKRGVCLRCDQTRPYTYAVGLVKVASYPDPVELRICKECVKELTSK